MPSAVVTSPYREVAETIEPGNLIRLTDAAYGDGLSTPTALSVDPEQVAFQIFAQGDADIPNDFDLSALWIFWGQFLDHDIDLTLEQHGDDAELIKFEPPFSVTRSDYVVDEDGVRQQQNVITPEIDASNVYGSDLDRQTALRSGEGGRLKVTEVEDGPDLLPTSDAAFGDGGTELVAGDTRAIENAALTSIHTLWVNEHNYWADRFAAEQPGATDEELFQQARMVVETLIQKITYTEFLPILLGDALTPYEGYTGADTSISTEFSTAAFRFGHTSIPGTLTFVAEDGTQAADDARLFDVFENSETLLDGLGSSMLRGLLEERAQKLDTKVVDDLNFFLFTPDGGLTGFSLPERNMLRGNDHGIDSYLAVRAAVVGDVDYDALVGSTDFSIISSDPEVQAAFAAVYGTVDQVHLWAGGLAEDYVPGTTLGITFQTIQAEQFNRLREGDPFYYENREWVDTELYEELMDTNLADVLMRSGGVEYVQDDALLASNRIAGTERPDEMGDAGFYSQIRDGFFREDEGDDHLFGTEGRDLMIGFSGNDILKGKTGDDDLFGGDDNDRLYGGRGEDNLNGGDGRDRLFGGADDDVLYGGNARDIMNGGLGDDRFEFVAGDSGIDVIMDFGVGKDVIALKGFGADAGDIEISGTKFLRSFKIDGELVGRVAGPGAEDLDVDDFIFIA